MNSLPLPQLTDQQQIRSRQQHHLTPPAPRYPNAAAQASVCVIDFARALFHTPRPPKTAAMAPARAPQLAQLLFLDLPPPPPRTTQQCRPCACASSTARTGGDAAAPRIPMPRLLSTQIRHSGAFMSFSARLGAHSETTTAATAPARAS